MEPERDRDAGAARPGRAEVLWLNVGAALFVVAQSWSFGHGELQAKLRDSLDYARVGHEPLFSLGFLAGDRAPGFPLFWRILGFSHAPTLAAHVVLGTVAWLALAWQASRVLRHRELRVVAFWVVLLLALSPQIGVWNGIAGSESLSLSTMALGLATAIGWARHPAQRWRGIALVLLSLLFAFTRDANAYLVLLAGLGVLGWWAVRRWGARDAAATAGLAVCGVALVAVGSLAYASSEHGNRWRYPYTDVLVFRVLPDHDRLAWFADEGLPVEQVREVARRYAAGAKFYRLVEDPRYDDLWAWEADSGRSAYLRYLATHPGFTLDGVTASFDESLSSRAVDRYGVLWDHHPPPGQVLTDLVYPHWSWLFVPWVVGVAAGTVLVARRRRGAHARGDGGWLFAWWWGTASVVVVFAVVWAADPYEIARHEIVPVVAFRLFLWLATLFVVDRLIPERRALDSTEAARDSTEVARSE